MAASWVNNLYCHNMEECELCKRTSPLMGLKPVTSRSAVLHSTPGPLHHKECSPGSHKLIKNQYQNPCSIWLLCTTFLSSISHHEENTFYIFTNFQKCLKHCWYDILFIQYFFTDLILNEKTGREGGREGGK